MAQAKFLPTSFTLRRKFEELPLFWSFHNGQTFRGGLLSGEFEIEFDQAGEWSISDVWVETDNGKLGVHAQGKLVNLDADKDERFYLTVLDSLTLQYSQDIPYWVDDEIGSYGLARAA